MKYIYKNKNGHYYCGSGVSSNDKNGHYYCGSGVSNDINSAEIFNSNTYLMIWQLSEFERVPLDQELRKQKLINLQQYGSNVMS